MTFTRHTQGSFPITLSDLERKEKYSSIARPLCDSWTFCSQYCAVYSKIIINITIIAINFDATAKRDCMRTNVRDIDQKDLPNRPISLENPHGLFAYARIDRLSSQAHRAHTRLTQIQSLLRVDNNTAQVTMMVMTRRWNSDHLAIQVAMLSQRGRAMLRVCQ